MPISRIKVDNIEGLTGTGIGIPDGTVTSPGLKFTADGDSGLYRIGSNNIGIATNGTRVGEIGAGYGGFTGNIIQVQNTFLNTTVTISVTGYGTFYDISGLSVNITPRYTSSKILILCQITHSQANNYVYEAFRLVRDSTTIGVPASSGSRSLATGTALINAASSDVSFTSFIQFVDSPNTTSQITYKPQITQSASGGSTSIYINRSSGNADSGGTFLGTSSIIVMEIQQ